MPTETDNNDGVPIFPGFDKRSHLCMKIYFLLQTHTLSPLGLHGVALIIYVDGSGDQECAVTETELFQVRLSTQQHYWYTRDQLEPWTRGVFVISKRSGKCGEIIRVDLRIPPTKRPYLVRLEDGREFWLLHGLHVTFFII